MKLLLHGFLNGVATSGRKARLRFQDPATVGSPSVTSPYNSNTKNVFNL